MRTDIQPATPPQVVEYYVQQIVGRFEGVGARISLLAQELDVPLGSSSGLDAALQCDADLAQSRNKQRKESKDARRRQRMRQELRGLLVLRYRAVRKLARHPSVGPQATRDMLLCANEGLLCKGFSSEAPGLKLPVLFEGLDDSIAP